jgi:hypothetical protein
MSIRIIPIDRYRGMIILAMFACRIFFGEVENRSSFGVS